MPGRAILLAPARATAPGSTHAALVVSARRYQDFTATLTVRTLRQLRHGAAGAPHPWEVGWVLWHFTSNQRFYALTLEATRLGAVQAGPGLPRCRALSRLGAHAGLPGRPRAPGRRSPRPAHRITIRADGHLLTRFTDTQRPVPDRRARPVLRGLTGPVRGHPRPPAHLTTSTATAAAGAAAPAQPCQLRGESHVRTHSTHRPARASRRPGPAADHGHLRHPAGGGQGRAADPGPSRGLAALHRRS